MEADIRYMQRCIQLAKNGQPHAAPNPMVGAVIVADGRIIGEGYHRRCGEAHAEVNAFAAVKSCDEVLLPQSTLYVNLEPCSHHGKTPPCADLIVAKRVRRVVVGCIDSFAKVCGNGIRKLQDAGIEVTVGVLEKECRELNRSFFTFHLHHRPYIILKWAQTADGFIDCNGCPMTISTPFTRMLCHKLRAESGAILVGRITDEREHPRLDVRHWSGPNPLRLVLSHSTPIAPMLDQLYQSQIQTLIVEGGMQTHQSFIEAGLWDEIRIETSPMTAETGTHAPLLPPHARLIRHTYYDGNTINVYRNEP
ncbi:MAG: bifunctional diaminohydroxyphosphoribosylaminopyrimidine deaminase/5-amino-6-(5-phosphoribosylamino)uracil reductase RibD [Prevotella sp.]|nr:bifunctional diaminohydroxyphosphoribosylaminopyrimidine deaminase/5-amino-6-(5-phosphoribosylamino)uracil reductase RibD [Prevotella sp.]